MKHIDTAILLQFEYPVKSGDLEATLIAQIWMNSDKSMNIEFMDVKDAKYRGVDINDFTKWREFKEFHKSMGIEDYDEILNKLFEEKFTESAVRNEIAKLDLNFNGSAKSKARAKK